MSGMSGVLWYAFTLQWTPIKLLCILFGLVNAITYLLFRFLKRGVFGEAGVAATYKYKFNILALFHNQPGVSGKGFLAPGNGKGTGIRKLLREGKGNLRLVIPGIPGII